MTTNTNARRPYSLTCTKCDVYEQGIYSGDSPVPQFLCVNCTNAALRVAGLPPCDSWRTATFGQSLQADDGRSETQKAAKPRTADWAMMQATTNLCTATRDLETHAETDDTTAALNDAMEAAMLLNTVTRRLIERARYEGQSWSQIGTTLGVSKQAAQQRYGL